jgi:hypothetical protein
MPLFRFFPSSFALLNAVHDDLKIKRIRMLGGVLDLGVRIDVACHPQKFYPMSNDNLRTVDAERFKINPHASAKKGEALSEDFLVSGDETRPLRKRDRTFMKSTNARWLSLDR